MAAICVYCASSRSIPDHYLDLAREVGAQIARRGHTLVTGGGAVSMMGAVARAARQGGAHTIGVIPEALMAYEIGDRDAGELVVTEDMRERKAEMDQRADAFLALPGGLGTLEELFEVWVARTLGMHDKPVVVLDPDGLYDPLRALVDHLVARGFARPVATDAIAWTSSVDDAFAALTAPAPAIRPTSGEVLEAEP